MLCRLFKKIEGSCPGCIEADGRVPEWAESGMCKGVKNMELWDLYDSERKPLNRTHVRGEAFAEGEYYVCAEVWVRNSKGEFLITKRHPDKKAGNLWEFTGGGTLAGESTRESAIRELQEDKGFVTTEQSRDIRGCQLL